MDQEERYEAAARSMIAAAELARKHRDTLLRRMGGLFARQQSWLQAGKYLDSLINGLPRKNGWTLAEHAGDATPDKMQRLLNHAVWDQDQAMGIVCDFVVEHLTADQAAQVTHVIGCASGAAVQGEGAVCGELDGAADRGVV